MNIHATTCTGQLTTGTSNYTDTIGADFARFAGSATLATVSVAILDVDAGT